MKRIVTLFLLMLFAGVAGVSGQVEETKLNLSEGLLPLDPAVTIGRLDNGLTYIIRRNSRPENRAELRLVVNAGSVLETDDQQGLAHLLEHMAFNGTEKFKKQELVDYLESIGTRFGPDLNAYTGFDETVYLLQVPADDKERLWTGFEILREWAGNISLETADIDEERGVIVEEWRLGRGAQARVRDRHFPEIFRLSRYAERLPIGSVDVIQNAPAEEIRSFYRDWYRPDLMSVIAVGDFDSNEVENRIRELFSDLSSVGTSPLREEVEVPDHEESRISIVSDPELPFGSVTVLYKHPVGYKESFLDYRQQLVEALYHAMMNDRLQEKTLAPEPPYAAAFSGTSALVRSREVYQLAAIVTDGSLTDALHTLLTEAERVRMFGFTTSELERGKADLLRRYESAFEERDRTESATLASEYVSHFLENDPIPGIEFEYAFVERVLPGISLDEINQVGSSRITRQNRVILVDGPDNDNVSVPAEADILAVFDSVVANELTAYEDSVSDEPLIPYEPAAALITGESVDDTIGVTRFELANGVKVVMKPTDFKNDEVLFSATSPGGSSLVSDEEYVSASFAAGLVGQSGLGAFGPIELQKKLAGTLVSVSPSISSRSEGLGGSASPRDLETLFQLIHLYFKAPRLDSDVYESFRTNIGGMIRNMATDPQSAFQDTISVTMSQYHFRARPISQDVLNELDSEVALNVFQDRFADADDFTFYFVGSFDPQEVKRLSSIYLGSLPNSPRVDEPRDTGVRSPDRALTKTVYKGIEPQSTTRVMFAGPAEWSVRNNLALDMMIGVLRIRMREVLREELAGTYYVQAAGSISKEPIESYRISLGFGSDPEQADSMFYALQGLIDELKTSGPSAENMSKVLEENKTGHEQNLKENRFWLSQLLFIDRYELDGNYITSGSVPVLESISQEDVIEMAKTLLDESRMARFVLLPENEND